MKFTLYFWILHLVLATAVLRGDSASVKLIGPEKVHLATSTCSFWRLPYEIEFTWDRDKPVELDLYIIDGIVKAGPSVDFVIRDSSGRELPAMFFMSMPSMPNGHVSVQKGQHLRIPVYAWNGIVEVKADVPYTISAKISAKIGDDTRVKLISDVRNVVFSISDSKSKQAEPKP